MAKVPNLNIPPVAFTAGSDLSASSNRYLFVTYDGATEDGVIIATGASAPGPIGVLQNSPCDGEEAAVQMLGFTKLRVHTATSNIGIGSRLISDASGYGTIEQTTGCNLCQAVAYQAVTGTASAIITVWLTPYGVAGAAS